MENNSEFGFHLSNNMNLFGFSPNTGRIPVFSNPPNVEDSTLRNVPRFLVPGVHQSYRTPHFHHPFVPPVFNKGTSPTGPAPPQKRFLVFDQSGDKTTMIYTSPLHAPFQFRSQRAPQNLPTPYYNLSKNTDDEYIEDKSGDEMHENTEELNALLSSDNYTDDYSEDDEETSTGHSPSTMTDQNLAEEKGEEEEVDSFTGPAKKRKLLGEGLSSLKTFASSALENDDAESSCGAGNDSWTGGRRSRRERIKETVGVLQRIIPGVNGKEDAVVVIDEAIQYLRFLKVKAKDLGLE